MKAILLSLLLSLLIIPQISCSKSSEPAEENLNISLNPDPGTSVVPALAAIYPFKLLITSAVPKNGVKIDITGTRDSDNTIQFTQTSQTNNSTVKSVDMQLNSLVAGVLYTVKVDVVSLTTPTNKASYSFKIARK